MPGRSIGERLAWARERAGLNKNQLARLLGTSWQHVDHWERGRTEPSLASMRRIAEALAVSVDFLVGTRSDPGIAEPSGLERFLSELAPRDLTGEEVEWLRRAPVDEREAAPEGYLRLLEGLRGISERPPKRSERRRKVDPDALDRALRKRKGGAA